MNRILARLRRLEATWGEAPTFVWVHAARPGDPVSPVLDDGHCVELDVPDARVVADPDDPDAIPWDFTLWPGDPPRGEWLGGREDERAIDAEDAAELLAVVRGLLTPEQLPYFDRATRVLVLRAAWTDRPTIPTEDRPR